MRQILLFCFGLGWAGVDIPVYPNLKSDQLSGKWYPILTAKGDPAKRPFKAFELEPFGDGGLIINVEIPQGKTCVLKRIAYNQIRPGIFKTDDGTATIHIVDTDYRTYKIAHFMAGNLTLLHLNSRSKELPEKVHHKFQGWVKKLGFNPNWVFRLKEEDLCSDGTKGKRQSLIS